MPVIKISKIKVRRGSNDQRRRMVFDQGELIHTIDTQRLYVGTGTLSGGSVVGTKFHLPLTKYTSLSLVISEVGDIINVNNMSYQLTASNYADINSWASIGTKLNPTHFSYDSDNRVSLNLSSISVEYLAPSSANSGVKIEGGVIKANYNPTTLGLVGNILTIATAGVSSTQISPNAFDNTITGGGNGSLIGVALTYGDKLVYTPSTPKLDVNPYAVNLQSSIYSAMTGTDTNISTFNGSMDGNYLGGNQYAGTTQIAVCALCYFGTPPVSSMSLSCIVLSSAGFITFENPGSNQTQIGQTITRFAIPIFTY